MGMVYRAVGPDEQRVALKILRTPERDIVAARFAREASIRIDHPNVIRVLDSGAENGVPYIALELLKGESLESRIQKGVLAPGEAVRIALEACAGLAAAHARGVVHRDLKPANLFLTEDGTVKVLDFGIAHLLEGSDLTTTGSILGTPAYLAPEQAMGKRTAEVRT